MKRKSICDQRGFSPKNLETGRKYDLNFAALASVFAGIVDFFIRLYQLIASVRAKTADFVTTLTEKGKHLCGEKAW